MRWFSSSALCAPLPPEQCQLAADVAQISAFSRKRRNPRPSRAAGAAPVLPSPSRAAEREEPHCYPCSPAAEGRTNAAPRRAPPGRPCFGAGPADNGSGQPPPGPGAQPHAPAAAGPRLAACRPARAACDQGAEEPGLGLRRGPGGASSPRCRAPYIPEGWPGGFRQ